MKQLTANQLRAARQLMANTTSTSITHLFQQSVNYKRNLNFDFGYPNTAELAFAYFYELYRRNGFARALVKATRDKTWETYPILAESEETAAKDETLLETSIRRHFRKLNFWRSAAETDVRSMVGKYGALILRLGDQKPFREPVDRVPGGIEGLLSVIPCWEPQIIPSAWDLEPTSETYGEPVYYTFTESAVDPEYGKVRSFEIHRDRVLLWSADGTTFGESRFEPCYNALMDLEKIRGAGGEGFWKNAKSQPVLNAGPEVDFAQLAQMLGTTIDGLPDALDAVLAKWNKGFDESLLLQQIDVKTLPVTLPSPEKFADLAIQEISASWPIPQKVLIGMQTGERASTEDARAWAQANMGRRENVCLPVLYQLVDRLQMWGMLPDRDWFIHWEDLTTPTLAEKLAVSKTMAEVNQAMFATGEAVFTDDEIRDVAGYAPGGSMSLDLMTEEPEDEEPDTAQEQREPGGADDEDTEDDQGV